MKSKDVDGAERVSPQLLLAMKRWLREHNVEPFDGLAHDSKARIAKALMDQVRDAGGDPEELMAQEQAKARIRKEHTDV